MVHLPRRNRQWFPKRGVYFCEILVIRLSWVGCTQPPTVRARLNTRSRVQGQASSPSFCLFSRLSGAARYHVKVNSSRLTWVDPLHNHFSPHLRVSLASAMPLPSRDVISNAKYFTQPADAFQPLALNLDDECLPEQVVQAGGFDVILYISSHI